jgi:hypothetical protein
LLNQLRIPPVILWACIVLVILFFIFLFRMAWECYHALGNIRRFKKVLSGVPLLVRAERRNGLQLERLEKVRSKCEVIPLPMKTWWWALEDSIEKYISPSRQEGWFLLEEARKVLPEETIIGRFYHFSFHSAVPGILTGLGLLATFVAILQALMGLHVEVKQGTETVVGIQTLIEGLSGKFLSSIVGLLLSVIFTLGERKLCERKLSLAYENFLGFIEGLFPPMSLSRIQLDALEFNARQAVSLGNISAEVVNRFVGAFRDELTPAFTAGISQEMARELQTEFRPTMLNMSETLTSLRSAIERLEAQKRDSITGELRGLIQSLEISITQALGDMGERFHSSLSGAANAEFEGVAGTLKGTAQLVQEMNTQFSALPAALEQVVEVAKQTSREQLDSGRAQIGLLSERIESLLDRMSRNADGNIQAITTSLTEVVTDLSAKVGDLSASMIDTVNRATQGSRETADKIIHSAGTWSEESAKRLQNLVSSIELRSKDFETASKTLLATHEAMNRTLVENHNVLESISAISARNQSYVTTLTSLGIKAEETQKNQSLAATAIKEAVNNLNSKIAAHESLLAQYRSVFAEYQGVFTGLDKQLSAALDSVNAGLQKYYQSVEGNFRAIVDSANRTVPPMANALKSEIDQLSDKLEELSDVLDKGITGLGEALDRGTKRLVT